MTTHLINLGCAYNTLTVAGRARAFYGTIAAATFVGVMLNFTPLDPVRALFWSAVINGVAAGGPDHGHDHADGLAAAGDGPVHADAVAEDTWLARHRCDGRHHRD